MIVTIRLEELNLRFHVKVDNYDYILFATSFAMRCFGCKDKGHTVKMCLDKFGTSQASTGEKSVNPAARCKGTTCIENACGTEPDTVESCAAELSRMKDIVDHSLKKVPDEGSVFFRVTTQTRHREGEVKC